jgi:hypothetical protein
MNSGHRRALRNVLMGVAMVLVPSTLWAGGLTLPHAFAPATPIKAQDMNDNFTAIATAMNKQTTLRHVANATNSGGDYTCIDDPSANGDPNAMIIITHSYAFGTNASYITAPVGVFYTGTTISPNNRWCIYREDQQPIAATSAFNVMVIKQ